MARQFKKGVQYDFNFTSVSDYLLLKFSKVEQDETDYNCGEEAPEYAVYPTNQSCFWHIYVSYHQLQLFLACICK